MKIKNLIAVAALLLGSTSASAQLASGGFKLNDLGGGKVEISDFADDYTFASDGVVTIPATLANTAGDPFNVVGIADNAFLTLDEDLRLKVKGVSFAASVEYIGEDAFADFGNLATVTFAEDSKLKYIATGAFAKDPMLKTISFANCPDLKYFTEDGTDGADDVTPFVNAANPTNTTLTSIVLNEATAYIGTALANVTKLATVNIKDTKIRTLVEGALENNEVLKALELPEKKYYNPETGEFAYSVAVALEAGALKSTKIETLIINGNVVANGIDALGATTLTSVTIKGDVASEGILEGAFAGNTKLATVTFEGALAAGAVSTGAFTEAGTAATAVAGIKMTVNAKNKDNANNAFNQKAFAGAEGDLYILLLTDASAAIDPVPYCVKWTAAPDAPEKIYVESNDDVTFYAKFFSGANTAISRGKGDVVVYSAYTDGETIYMDPLYSVDDKYVVEAGEPVIVKVKGTSSLIKSDDKGKYIECEGTLDNNTMRYAWSDDEGNYVIVNEIGYNLKITNQDLNALAGEGNMIYAVAKISTNGLKWKAISNEGTFYVKDAFYIEAKKAAAGVRVVWLDEENATAIQTVKKANAEKGAIYNLAGQKVNAAYKGVVIKDGKKYIQK